MPGRQWRRAAARTGEASGQTPCGRHAERDERAGGRLEPRSRSSSRSSRSARCAGSCCARLGS